MSAYRRLTLEERYQILILKESNFGVREIAFRMKRSPSSICRELKRNNPERYDPKKAHQRFKSRRALIGPQKKIAGELKVAVDACLSLQWSPEQTSAALLKKNLIVSHETIYKYIYQDYRTQGTLFLNLRWARKMRRSREVTRNWKRSGMRLGRTPIAERDAIVEERVRVGDYERDTVLGKNGRLLTIVDRTSRLTKIAKIDRNNSFDTHQETINLLQDLTVHTVTNDHGTEFGLHAITEQQLNAKVYFATPYCAWQRGTNENTNGLIRQYFPKGTDFSKVSIEEIKRVEHLLNERPRKCLGYQTPNEVHRRLSQTVALSFLILTPNLVPLFLMHLRPIWLRKVSRSGNRVVKKAFSRRD
ncbi:MAG: IS30 family transposase [Proteobacteria bacterium]|nr:MAG: IS30 family transposase [Pseudomonadota bacterium]